MNCTTVDSCGEVYRVETDKGKSRLKEGADSLRSEGGVSRWHTSSIALVEDVVVIRIDVRAIVVVYDNLPRVNSMGIF